MAVNNEWVRDYNSAQFRQKYEQEWLKERKWDFRDFCLDKIGLAEPSKKSTQSFCQQCQERELGGFQGYIRKFDENHEIGYKSRRPMFPLSSGWSCWSPHIYITFALIAESTPTFLYPIWFNLDSLFYSF